jgi:hypothetical protein
VIVSPKFLTLAARFSSTLVLLGSLSGCSGFFSGSREVPISPASIKELTTVLETEYFVESIPLLNEQKPNTIIFVVNFDGTNNDREQVPPGETKTVVAQLFDKVEGSRDARSPIRKIYLRGPGCADAWWCVPDAAFGISSRSTASNALAQLERFIAQNPSATEVKVLVVGFSRGAATARHFLNKVYEASQKGTLGTSAPVWSSAILIETVVTGQSYFLNLAFPPNLEFALHLVAKNETRTLFPPVVDDDTKYEQFTRHFSGLEPQPRVFTVRLPGAHSDLGDSYDSGAGPQVTRIATNIIEKMGLKKACLNSCDEDTVVDICKGTASARMVSDGLHDSRGKLDHLLGARSPYSKGFERKDGMTAKALIDIDQAERIYDRIISNRTEHPDDVLTMNQFSTRGSLVFKRKARETEWHQIIDSVESRGEIVVSQGVPALILTWPHKGKRDIPEVVRQAMDNEAGDTTLDLVLFKCEEHWFVNGYIPGDQ